MSIILDTVKPIATAGRAEMLYVWFVRLMSILCLLAAVGYWAGLSGVSGFYGVAMLGTQTVAVSALNVGLAVLFPVAMLGLWLHARWGVAIWFLLLAVQIAAHTAGAPIFGTHIALVAGNTVLIVTLCVISLYLIYSRYVVANGLPSWLKQS